MRLAYVAYPLTPGDGWWNLELDFCVAKVRPRRLLHIQTSHSLDQRNPAIWASLRFSYMRLLDWQRFSTANSWPKLIHLIQTPRKNSLAQEQTSSGDEAITTPSPASWLEPLTHWLGRPSRGMCEIVMVKVRHDLIELFSMHCSIHSNCRPTRFAASGRRVKFHEILCLVSATNYEVIWGPFSGARQLTVALVLQEYPNIRLWARWTLATIGRGANSRWNPETCGGTMQIRWGSVPWRSLEQVAIRVSRFEMRSCILCRSPSRSKLRRAAGFPALRIDSHFFGLHGLRSIAILGRHRNKIPETAGHFYEQPGSQKKPQYQRNLDLQPPSTSLCPCCEGGIKSFTTTPHQMMSAFARPGKFRQQRFASG